MQIRTEEMHHLAENGVASHWLYKERNRKIDDVPQLQWLRDLVDRQRDESDSKEFMQSLKLDLFKNEIYLFTPRGEVKELPEGSTPIDFAYHIHSDIGHHCVGAKVNGKLTPLSTPLKSGDTIEIITDKKKNPNRDWLKFVKTSRARSRIQHYLNTKERDAAVQLGREMLDKEAKKLGINVNKAIKDGSFGLLREDMSFNTLDDVISAVGYTKITPRKLLTRYLELTGKELPEEEKRLKELKLKEYKEHREAREQKEASPKKQDGIVIQGQNDMLVRFAQCCSPLPGDHVIGFISRGRGIVVHTSACPHIQELEPERLITVSWSSDKQMHEPFPVRIHVYATNQKGTLAKISEALAQQDVNIIMLMMVSLVDGRADIEMTLELRDVVHLYQTIDKLRHLEVVQEVTRSVE